MLARPVPAVVEVPQLGPLRRAGPSGRTRPGPRRPAPWPGPSPRPGGRRRAPRRSGARRWRRAGSRSAAGCGTGRASREPGRRRSMSCTLATTSSCRPAADPPVPELEHLGEVVPGVDVQQARTAAAPARTPSRASRSSTTESLPPENSSTGRSKLPATSRSTCIDSSSRSSSCAAATALLASSVTVMPTPPGRAGPARRRPSASTVPSVSSRSSGDGGGSYASSTPVRPRSWPAYARAYRPFTSRAAHSSTGVATCTSTNGSASARCRSRTASRAAAYGETTAARTSTPCRASRAAR